MTTYVRATADERVLVIHNLSDISQIADLDQSTEFGQFSEVIRGTEHVLIENNRVLIPAYITIVIK